MHIMLVSSVSSKLTPLRAQAHPLLRYLMHRHRLLALAVLSTLFFFWELLSALLVWSLLSSRPEKAALLPQTKGLLVSPSLPSPKESNVAASTGIANRSATRRQQQRPTESVDSKSFVKTEDETGEGLKEGFFGAKLSVQKTKLEDFDLVDAVKEDEGLESETLIGNAESSDRTRDSEPAPKTDEADDTLSDTSSLSVSGILTRRLR